MVAARTTLLAGTLLLGACATDLHTAGLGMAGSNAGGDPGALPAGFVYNLPAAVVSPKASIRIAGCKVDEGAEQLLRPFVKADGPLPITKAEFAMSGDIAVEQVPGQPVLIDYRELADFLKTSSIGIERHPNFMLKSVNVSVEDQSPQLIANLATVAADIALFTVKPGAGPLPGLLSERFGESRMAGVRDPLAPQHLEPVSYLACKPQTAKLVAGREEAVKRRDAATQALEEATAALEKLTRSGETGFTANELTLIHQYRDTMLTQAANVTGANEDIASLDSKLSLRATATQEPTSVVQKISDKKPVLLTATPQQVGAFVARHFVVGTALATPGIAQQLNLPQCTAADDTYCGVTGEVQNKLNAASFVAQRRQTPSDGLTPRFDAEAPSYKHRSGPIRANRGIVYVEPARYTLSLVWTDPKDPAMPTVLKSVEASIPQLGTYIGLPVHAGFGEKVELKATFNTDGSLATASYGKPSAAGVALTGTLASLADKALATRDAMAERKLKMLKGEADRLTAQQSIVDAQAKLSPKADPLAGLRAQIAVAEANAALAEANLRIRLANAQGN